MAYTAYVLTQTSRKQVLEAFPPKYEQVICHHVTVQFGVPEGTPKPSMPRSIKIIGYVDSGDGVEALAVSVDGETVRPDGNSLYHITLSLAPGRRPVESNKYITQAQAVPALTVMAVPQLVK